MSKLICGKFIFGDYFYDNRHQWPVQDSDEYSTKFASSYYLLEHKRENGSKIVWHQLDAEHFANNANFHLYTVVKKLAGDDGEYGIVWGLADINNFFHFLISGQYYRDRLAVIVAGYSIEMLDFLKSNPGLESRFSRQVRIDRYTPDELMRIFAKLCRENGYMIDLPARFALESMFEYAYSHQLDRTFGNGRFVRNVFEGSIEQQANRIVKSLGEINNQAISLITIEDLEKIDD
jgi:AAA lid domain